MYPSENNLAQNLRDCPYILECLADEKFCANLVTACGNYEWYKYCPTRCTESERAIGLLSVDYSDPKKLWSGSRYNMAYIVMDIRRAKYKCTHSANYWRDLSYLYPDILPNVQDALKYLGWVRVP